MGKMENHLPNPDRSYLPPVWYIKGIQTPRTWKSRHLGSIQTMKARIGALHNIPERLALAHRAK
jgi:hypothetical protein